MKVKGIKMMIISVLLASIMMPFSISAAEQTQIVPTWNWGSQYANQFTVTNFCEGSGTSVSCELRFTANNSYYGYLSFDGYNGTTKWIDYKNVWIADGYGAYRYSLYQNGVIQINKINIEGGFLKSSMDNLDLQDIIDLLTAIETDTTSIDNQINTQLQRIQSIINNQITANGYLDILTKLRQYNIVPESYLMYLYMLENQYSHVYDHNFYMNYPVFKYNANEVFFHWRYFEPNRTYCFIMFLPGLPGSIQLDTTKFRISNARYIASSPLSEYVSLYCYYFEITNLQNSNSVLDMTFNFDYYICPIAMIWKDQINNVSTDFALRYGLSNQLINDLHVIAQGTQQSNSAASGLESSNSTMASDMNSMATIENGYSQDFNSQLQNIDFTNPIQQNQGILPAANFVISIFNGLISNNPFTVLIIIVCILLIGKKVIGK